MIYTWIKNSSSIQRCLSQILRREGDGDLNNIAKTSARVGKCGPGSTILSITLPKEGVLHPRTGDTTEKTSRI